MLTRAFARMGSEGKISIPNNIRRQLGIRAGQLVEFRVVGASKRKLVLLSARESAR